MLGGVSGRRNAKPHVWHRCRQQSVSLERTTSALVKGGSCSGRGLLRQAQGEAGSQEPDVTMKNGKPALSGLCPVCGTKVFKIGG